jgi:hypothetical protein
MEDGRHPPAMHPGLSVPYGPGRRLTPPWRRGQVAAGRMVFLAADPIVEAGHGLSQFLRFLLKALEIALMS